MVMAADLHLQVLLQVLFPYYKVMVFVLVQQSRKSSTIFHHPMCVKTELLMWDDHLSILVTLLNLRFFFYILDAKTSRNCLDNDIPYHCPKFLRANMGVFFFV